MIRAREFLATVSQEYSSHVAILAKRYDGYIKFEKAGEVDRIYIKAYFTDIKKRNKFVYSLDGIIDIVA